MSQLPKMPTVFTFALVDVVSEDLKMSRGKARKAILRGQVWVDGVAVLHVNADAGCLQAQVM